MGYRDNPFVYVTADNGKVVHIPLSEFLEWEDKKKAAPDPEAFYEEEPQTYGLGHFVYVTGDDGHVVKISNEEVEDWEKKHKL